MVKIQGGEIELRDDRIKSKWKTEIRPFLLARYPVTTSLYYAITNKSPNSFDGELDKIAWYNENSGGEIHEVGRKEPNAWGLYDMLGNVWEWCFDLYDEQVYGSYRIFRGGSWAEEARGCGASCRRRSHPSFRIDDLGFRLAQSL
ncbi:MAG: formylglycine-generating enzyme family protein [Bacillota bacterium]